MVAAALLGVVVSQAPQAKAANLTWNQTVAGNYSWVDSANWGGAGSPNAIGDVANLSGALGGLQTVSLNAVITLGELIFGATAPATAGYTLAAGTNGLLILDDTDGAVSINKILGSPSLDKIDADIQFNDALTISNNAGGGTLTITGAMRSVTSDITITGIGAVAAGSIITGAISTAGGLIKEGTGIMQTNGAGTYAGTTWIKAGRLIMNTGTSFPVRSAIIIEAGAVLEVKGVPTWGSITGAGNVTNTSTTSIRTITLGRDDTSTSFTGTITSSTALNIVITKIGAGTLTLQPAGANASTYTGLTTISGGKIALDTSASSLTSGFLAGTALTLGGGAFEMIGRSGATVTQTLGNLIVTGAGVITVTANGGAATNLRFGTFTNSAVGTTLLVTAPTNTVVSNTTTALTNNILGAGRAVFSDGAGALNWLSQGSTTPFQWTGLGTGVGTTPAYTGTLPADGTGVATGNYTLSGGQLQSTAASTINTLKITSSGPSQSLDLDAFNLTASGFLITGTDAYEIKATGAGALTAATDLVIHQFNSGGLTINAPLSGAGMLTMAGTGVLTLGTGTNTMTGPITINAGVLSFSSVTSGAAGSLGAGLTTAVNIRDGGTLRYTGVSGTIIATATTAGAHTYNLTGGNATIEVTTANTTLVLNGIISGAGGLTKAGAGILTLTGVNAYTGPTYVTSGTLKAGVATSAFGSSSSPLNISAGATVDVTAQDQTIGSLSGAGTIANSSTTAKTLTLGGANLSTTFTGAFTTAATGQAFTKTGTGILILAGSTTSTWAGNHQVNGGVLRLAASNLLAAAVPMFVANAAGPAMLELSSGVTQTVGSLSFGGTGVLATSQGTVLIGSGATLTLGGNFAYTSTNNPLPAHIIGAGGLSLGSSSRTFTIGDSASVTAGSAELTVSTPISGTTSIIKTGFGNLLLSAANTFSGATTTLTAGGLILDYTTQNNNKIPGANSLTLNGGGNLILRGNASASTSQDVLSTTLASGGFSTITLTPGGSQKIVFNMSGITRAATAGTIRFNLPTGTQDATNGIRTTTANVNGILGGWATATNVSGVTNFAANDGSGGVVPVTSAAKSDVTTWASADHVSDGASGYAGTVLQNLGVSSLRFDSVADSTVTIAAGRVLTIVSGGVLQTSAASGSIISPTLTGGRLVSGASSELIFTTDATTPARPLLVSSAIGGAHTLTKSGNGILKLSGVNDFTGVTYLKAGTLQVEGGNAIGDNSLVNLSTTRSSVFELLGNETIGGILGGNAAQGGETYVRLAANTLRINQPASQSLTAFLYGDAGSSFVLNAGSLGNLNYSSNTSATFLGSVVVNGGMFQMSGNGALGVTAITVTKAALLFDNNGTTRLATRIPDASPITLHSADGPWSGQTYPSGLAVRTDQNAGTSETIGALNFGSGASYLYATASGGTSAVAGVTASDFVRSQSATVSVRGKLLNSITNVTGRNFFRIASGTASETTFVGNLVGGGGAAGSTTISILPWAIGETADANPGDGNMGNSLVTYSAAISGLRPLDLATEFKTFATLAGLTDNIRESLTGDLPGLAGQTINALVVNNANLTAGSVAVAGTGASQTLTITAGTMLFTATGALTGTPAMGITLGGYDGGITVGGSNEYVVFVQNPTSAVVGGTVTATISSSLTSTADITKSGRGTLVLSVANTAGGGAKKTTINEGVLQIDALDKIGGSTGNLVFAGGTLKFGGAFDPSTRTISILAGGATLDTNGNNVTFANSLGAGAGALTKEGVGVLTLNAASTLTGGTNVNVGTLALGASGGIGVGNLALTSNAVLALGAGTGAVNQTVSQLSGASTNTIVGGDVAVSILTVNQSTTTTYAGSFGGVGANQNSLGLTKSGVGGLTLSGATLSYAGPTVVNGGTLNLTGSTSAALATSAVTVARGATLNFVNTVGQAINLGSGVLTLGASGTGNTVLGFELGALAAYDRINSTAAAVVSGEVLLNLTGLSGSESGNYDLLTAASGLTSGGATYALGSLTGLAGGARALTATDTLVRLSVTAFTSDLYWGNALGDGNWSANSLFSSNFATDLAGTNANGLPGVNDRVIFSANTAGSPTIATILNANFSIKDLEFAANPSGVTAVTIAPGTAGSLTLTPAVATDGIDVATSAGVITISAPVVLGANQRWNIVGGGTNGSALTVSGAITGAFSLEKTGAGILTLAVAGSSYSGTTTVAEGVLQAGIAQGFSNASAHIIQAAGILRLNNFDATIGSLAGAGTVENAGTANNRTLTTGGDSTSTTFSGTLQNGGAFALGLVKTGNGALTLSGTNTHTGTVTVSAGTLAITGSNAMGTGFFVVGNAAGSRARLQIGAGAAVTADHVDAGSNATAAGAIYQTGGAAAFTESDNTNNGIMLGGAAGGYGSYSLSGGTVTANRITLAGNAFANATGVYTQTGGTFTNSGWTVVGQTGGGVNALMDISGGTYIAQPSGTAGFGFNHGSTAYSVVNVRGTGILDRLAPGSVSTINLMLGNTSSLNNVGILNLSGSATLRTNAGGIISGAGTGSSGNLVLANFNGGTIITNAASSSLINILSTGANTAASGAYIYGGGLTVDTNGLNSTINGALRAPTAEGVSSIAVATEGSGYLSAPMIKISGGSGVGATAIANMVDDGSGNGTFKIGSLTITSPGTGYLNADTLTLAFADNASLYTTQATFGAVAFNGGNTSGGLTKIGVGTLTLSGANTFTGGTTVNVGTLVLGANNVLADAGNVTLAGGTLAFGTFNDTVATVSLQSGVITGSTGVLTSTAAFDLRDGSVDVILAGSVGLNKTTAGTVILSKANTYSGVTSITGGTLVFSTANQLGDASATNTLTLNGGTLSYTGSGSANLVANRVMAVGSGGATLNTPDAAGTLNLQGGIITSAAANLTKTGLGAVVVTGSTHLNGGNVTVSAGVLNAGFTASGLGAIAVSANATLNLYDGAATSMAITGLTLAAGSSLGFDLGATGVNDALSLTGPAVIAPSVSLNFNALGSLVAGSYNLLSVSTGTLNAADYVLGLAPSGLNYNFTTINAGQTLQLTTSLLNLVYWKGDVGGSWSANNAANTNWASDLAGSTDLGALPIATDTLVFSSSGAVGTTFTTTLDGSFTADSLKFTANPAGVTAVAVNQGSSGTLTLSPAGANNGISVPADAGAITIGAPIATGAIQTWEVVGGGANGSSLTVSGAVTISHIINKTGAGVLTLSGSNTGSGGLVLAAGTLAIGHANALGAGSLSIEVGTFLDTGAAAIVNAGNNVQNWNGNFTFIGTNTLNLGTGAVTLGDSVTATVSAQTLSVGGVIGDGAATFGLTKAGTAELILNGANTYGGLTNLVNGALRLNGDNSGAAGGVTIAAGATLRLGHANALGSGTLTLNGGTLDNTSGGVLTLGGNVAQTWNTGFTFTGTHNLVMGSGAVTLGATTSVTVTAGNLTVNGVIDDGVNTFNLEKTGAGTLTLGVANTYGGATIISAGTLAFTANQTLAAATNTLLFGATAASTTPGNLVLTADATFGGALIVNTNSATASQITIGSGKTLTFNANVQIGATAPEVNGTVTKLTLNGGGVFNVTTAAAGTFTVGGGTAAISQDATLDLTALASTAINTSATGTLRVNPSNNNNIVGAKATLLLPAPVVADTVATATITAGTIAVGNAGFFNNQAGQINTIRLGTGLTTLNANTINVGTGNRDIGQIIYGQAGGDLKIRAADGTSRATLIAIGTGGASTNTNEPTVNNLVDFSTHDADILVTTLNVGNQARTGSLISEFKFGAGDSSLASVLDATNVNIGFRTGVATATNILTNRVNISGGAVTFGNGAGTGTGVKVGSSAYDQLGAASTIGELNISGGTVLINNSTALAAAVQLGENVAAGGGTVTAAMNLTGGTTTLVGHIIRNATSLRTTSTVTLNGASAILNMGGKNIGSASALITFNAQAGTLRNLAELNGGGVLTKSTVGVLLLDTANAFTGGVTIAPNGGKVIAGHNNALGTGTITLNSNTSLELADGITLSNAFVATFQGNAKSIVLQSGATYATYAGNITNSEEVANNFDLSASAGGTLTVSGTISSGDPAAGFEKTGAGNVILSGTNTYTGLTTVSAGKLTVSSLGDGVTASSLGTAGLAPANLILATGVTLGYVGAGETSARGFTVSTASTLDASGTGALAFSSAAKVAFSSVSATRTLTLTGAQTGANSFGAGLSDVATSDASKFNLIVKDGVGSWIITNGESLKSTVQMDVNGGTLGLALGVLPLAGRVDLATGTTLRMETGNTDDLGSRIQLDAGAAVTLAVSSDVSFATALTVASAGSAAVTKSGAGKLTLAADNTAIAGGFTVAQGTLDVTHALGLGVANATVNGGRLAVNAVTANTVNVASGGTIGGGGALVAVNVASNGKLAPGNSAGMLTVGNVVLAGGSLYEWQVQDAANHSTGYDKLTVTGNLDLTGASSAARVTIHIVSLLGNGNGSTIGNPYNIDPPGIAAQPTVFQFGTAGGVLLNNGVNISDVFAFNVSSFTYADGSTSLAGLWSIDWNAGTGAITLTAVPEPSTYGFGLGALALAAAAIRRRRKQPAEPAA